MTENESILFISHLIPNDYYSEVISSSKNNMQDAASALQWHLIEGFNHNLSGNYDVVNFMPVGSFPQYYDKPFVKERSFDIGLSRTAIDVGFCNIKYLRRSSIARALKTKVEKWCKKCGERKKIIIIYTLNPILLEVLSSIKIKYSNIEICAIVADLPNMTNLSSKKSVIAKLAQKRFSDSAYSNIAIVDKFVFLTKQMSDYLGNTKPYCVMEGIATDFSTEHLNIEKQQSENKTVLYTGTLHRKFGVLQLLNAFLEIDDPDYRLVICGVGDSEAEIRKAATTDSRIDFRGQCPRDEVLKLQRTATVLVNPRMNNEEFTKYSFPSKNMEYLSSGTPLVAYKLDGIPDEYDNYINYPSDESVEALSEAIRYVCDKPFEERESMGSKAAMFVSENKNAVAQTAKIIELFS